MFKKHLHTTAVLSIALLILFVSSTFGQEIKEYEETISFSKTGTVSIDTYKGSISVETWDKDEVYFYAKVVPDTDGWNDTSPEEQLERCEVRYNKSNDYLSIESDYKKDFWGNNSGTLAFVHYEIKMPKTAELRIDDYKSTTTVTGLRAGIDMESYKGDMRFTDYSGDIFVDTYKGSVFIDYAEFTEDAEFDTYKGEIELELPADSKFDFDLDLGRKGDFESDFEMMMRSYSSDEGVRGRVNGGGPRIKFSTYKGEIELKEKR